MYECGCKRVCLRLSIRKEDLSILRFLVFSSVPSEIKIEVDYVLGVSRRGHSQIGRRQTYSSS